MSRITTLEVVTRQRTELVDITAGIRRLAAGSGIREGVAHIFAPHTTAAITINENADPTVVRDILAALERLVPQRGDYRHGEGNSDAHIKASLLGSSLTVLISGGDLLLGTWQGIFFCEFDGPRKRKVWVSFTDSG
ncbi:MAG: secondary thiamine-phosphate synthase enzyme YjbQ [Peptococcaceae bacterium]|nr:secondary thiamine-phosphate synthase enzyme YjbQ [Peptococcaceae bacterium]